MPNAARMGDFVKQDTPHCHAPIHPAAPTPTPVAHPGLPLDITGPPVPTIMIEGKPAVTATAMTKPCMLPSCVPAGPGVIVMGSTTVLWSGLPAARVDDPTIHASCVAPIPSLKGKVMSPGATTVKVGG